MWAINWRSLYAFVNRSPKRSGVVFPSGSLITT
jgi:hypothetical protein